jgi:hypothetical protein
VSAYASQGGTAAWLVSSLRSRLARLADVLEGWDEQESGIVSKKEFRQAVYVIAPDFCAEGERLFARLDTAKAGAIEYAPLLEQLRACSVQVGGMGRGARGGARPTSPQLVSFRHDGKARQEAASAAAAADVTRTTRECATCRVKLKVRSGIELHSSGNGELRAGEVVEVLERSSLPDGTQRARRVQRIGSGARGPRGGGGDQPPDSNRSDLIGWVSLIAKGDGKPSLVALDGQPPNELSIGALTAKLARGQSPLGSAELAVLRARGQSPLGSAELAVLRAHGQSPLGSAELAVLRAHGQPPLGSAELAVLRAANGSYRYGAESREGGSSSTFADGGGAAATHRPCSLGGGTTQLFERTTTPQRVSSSSSPPAGSPAGAGSAVAGGRPRGLGTTLTHPRAASASASSPSLPSPHERAVARHQARMEDQRMAEAVQHERLVQSFMARGREPSPSRRIAQRRIQTTQGTSEGAAEGHQAPHPPPPMIIGSPYESQESDQARPKAIVSGAIPQPRDGAGRRQAASSSPAKRPNEGWGEEEEEEEEGDEEGGEESELEDRVVEGADPPTSRGPETTDPGVVRLDVYGNEIPGERPPEPSWPRLEAALSPRLQEPPLGLSPPAMRAGTTQRTAAAQMGGQSPNARKRGSPPRSPSSSPECQTAPTSSSEVTVERGGRPTERRSRAAEPPRGHREKSIPAASVQLQAAPTTGRPRSAWQQRSPPESACDDTPGTMEGPSQRSPRASTPLPDPVQHAVQPAVEASPLRMRIMQRGF